MCKHAKVGMVLGALCVLTSLGMLPACLWAAPQAGGTSSSKAAGGAGCRDGWRRVGTVNDPTLRRSWAVVASCQHPAWPAHLEPASRWKELPKWVPAGSRVTVTAPQGVTSMRLEGKTLAPGRVGQTVKVRLIDGVRVRARLMAADQAEIETVARWRGR